MRAIIYLLDNAERERWERVCVDWCQWHDYDVVSLVVDDERNPQRWRSVVQMLAGRPSVDDIVARVQARLGDGLSGLEDVERAVREAFTVGTVADVCVVPRLDQLPAYRLPRVEMIAEEVGGRRYRIR